MLYRKEAIRRAIRFRIETKAALVLQTAIRRWLAHRLFRLLVAMRRKNASTKVQCQIRRGAARRRVARRRAELEHRRRVAAAVRIQQLARIPPARGEVRSR